MNRPIVKIGRDNHLNNLINKLPLITAIFGLQCFFIMKMQDQVNVGEFSTFMGLFLIGLISSLYIYNRHHHVIIYQDQILIYFTPFNSQRVVHMSDIDAVIAPEEECDFSSIALKLKSKETVSIHFVDYPLQVKGIIDDLKTGKDVSHKIEKAA